MHDHIIVYVKRSKDNKNDQNGWTRNLLRRSDEQTERYTNPDNDKRGSWASVDLTSNKSFEQRPNLYYPIINPFTLEEIWPPKQRVWRYEKNTLALLLLEDRIWWGEQKRNFPRAKRFLNEVQDGVVPSTWWTREFAGDNQAARREIRSLFDSENVDFDTPKPTQLLKKISEIATSYDTGDIVLDFFCGSGSIAHAILEMNQFDLGNRHFICVQIPEPLAKDSEAYKSGFKTIADIGKERIRRVIAKIKTEQQGNKDLFSEGQAPQDLGFKVFKLQQSHFKIWNAGVEKTPEAIQQQLFAHVDHLSPEAEQEAILYELLLKSGFEITASIEQLTIEGKKVFSIANGELLICLEKQLTHEVLKAIAERKPARVICLDEGFQNNDQLKTNAVQIMKSKGVVNFRTV
jgi:adenine-specific DNA-methyltransferase